MTEIPMRADMGLRKECTISPIFLLQRRIWRIIGLPAHPEYRKEYEHDGEGIRLGTTSYKLSKPPHWEPDDDSEYLTGEQLADMEDERGHPCALEEWVTESVWFTRDEAEKFAKTTEYNFRDGWQVYCVSARGDLSKVLAAHTCSPTGRIAALRRSPGW